MSRLTQLWLYLHFPLVVAIAAGGAGALNTVEHSAKPLPDSLRWLLVGSLASAVLAIATLAHTLQTRATHLEAYQIAERTTILSAALMVAVGVTGWGAKATIGALVLLLIAPIMVGIVVWLRHTDPEPGAFGAF